MNSQIAPLPWEQHLPQVVFCHNGASARLVASHGASFATVYVACSCPTCETRPLASFRTGGCVLGLGDWALHVGLKAASLAEIQVIQSKAGEKVPLAAWLQSASLSMGGEYLRRRQINVFHWNGKLVAESDDTLTKPGHRHDSPTTQLPSAYEGLGIWRAATIRGYDSMTCRFEIKYHDEPKRSQAHIWLPLTVLHFARNPPPSAAAVRSCPDTPMQLPGSPLTSPYDGCTANAALSLAPAHLHIPVAPRPWPLIAPTVLCTYAQLLPLPPPPLPPPKAPLPLPAQAQPAQHQDIQSFPLLGSFHSMPTAPASPAPSIQGSPMGPSYQHYPSATAGSVGISLQQTKLALGPERAAVPPTPRDVPQVPPPPRMVLPYDGCTTSPEVYDVATDCGRIAAAAAAAAMPVVNEAGSRPPHRFAELRIRSFVSSSANSDSGSSNSVGVGATGHVTVSGAVGESTSDTEGEACRIDSHSSHKSRKREAAFEPIGGAHRCSVGGDFGDSQGPSSDWQPIKSRASSGQMAGVWKGNATGGGSQLAALEAPCSVRVPPGPTFSRMSGNAGVGVTGWSLWDRSSHGPVEGGPPGAADVPVGLGTGGWGESSDVAVAVVPCSSGAAICPDHALAAPVSDAPWAQPITPGADDDDIAALYAELCSDMCDEVAVPNQLSPPSRRTGGSIAHRPPTTAPPPSLTQSFSALLPTVFTEQDAVADADRCSFVPPLPAPAPSATAVMAAVMQPGPPPPLVCPDASRSIHPVLIAALLERQQQHRQQQQYHQQQQQQQSQQQQQQPQLQHLQLLKPQCRQPKPQQHSQPQHLQQQQHQEEQQQEQEQEKQQHQLQLQLLHQQQQILTMMVALVAPTIDMSMHGLMPQGPVLAQPPFAMTSMAATVAPHPIQITRIGTAAEQSYGTASGRPYSGEAALVAMLKEWDDVPRGDPSHADWQQGMALPIGAVTAVATAAEGEGWEPAGIGGTCAKRLRWDSNAMM